MRGSYLSSSLVLGEMEPSIGAMLATRSGLWGAAVAFREREEGGTYGSLAWTDLLDRVRRAGSWLLAHGIRKGDRVATYSRNSADMLVWELAVMSCGALSVPIFARYSPLQLSYLLEHSGARLLLAGNAEQLACALGTAPGRKLEGLVLTCTGDRPADRPADRPPHAHATADPPIVSFNDVLAHPADEAFDAAVAALRPDDPCLVMYTSGTTGVPKGVVLEHGNILSQQKALSQLWHIVPGDVFLSYLPWHHSFGGLFERFTALAQGATLCLDDSGGRDIPRLIANWREILPTHFFSVPKIFQALVTECRLDLDVEETVFHPGLKFVFTAAAPLPKDCSDYFANKGVPVLEGWGLTETSPCVTLTSPVGERIPGIVGLPLPGVEVLVGSEREIFVRGPNVMQGYYCDSERTEQVIDPQGWFSTGDLGEVTDLGLRIICRVDGLFKLTNGEKVPSAVVEGALAGTSRFIEQAVVLGAGRDYVAALLFPNLRNIEAWAREHGRGGGTPERLLADPDVAALLRAEVEERNASIEPAYMRIRAYSVVPAELTIEAGELTPSMKVVRNQVVERHHDLVDALFKVAGSEHLGHLIVRFEPRAKAQTDRLSGTVFRNA